MCFSRLSLSTLRHFWHPRSEKPQRRKVTTALPADISAHTRSSYGCHYSSAFHNLSGSSNSAPESLREQGVQWRLRRTFASIVQKPPVNPANTQLRLQVPRGNTCSKDQNSALTVTGPLAHTAASFSSCSWPATRPGRSLGWSNLSVQRHKPGLARQMAQ